MTSLPASDWIIMITKREQFAPRWMFIPYLWSSLLWHDSDFSSPLLSAARKSDATMQKTGVNIVWLTVRRRLPVMCIDTLFFRKFFVSQSLVWGITILASIFIWVYQFFIYCALGLRVYAIKWGSETNSKVLDSHYLLAFSIFLGLAEPKSNAFITIG